jgi:redox-sensitive bicupin YhaK (pirin superfamily)
MSDMVLDVQPLGFQWPTRDPFLFCVHHLDDYPAGNAELGPNAPLSGRQLGQDFAGRDGWRMYHGRKVPGFPQHPHRGFETVTIVRRGFVDHSDSLGAAGRYGPGDVQWMTAGAGVVHAEMFPLLRQDAPNPLELFQIWLNLPAQDKLVDPYYAMLWAPDIPFWEEADQHGRLTRAMVVAGQLHEHRPPSPPPHSWAAHPDSDVAIWCIRMDPGARCTLPRAGHAESVRTAYFFAGQSLVVGGERCERHGAYHVSSGRDLELVAGETECELLLLQGRPIGEPVAQYGPFVMNTAQELDQTVQDYHRTRFGGWPWPSNDPVHPRDAGRFAHYSAGTPGSPAPGPPHPSP